MFVVAEGFDQIRQIFSNWLERLEFKDVFNFYIPFFFLLEDLFGKKKIALTSALWYRNSDIWVFYVTQF